MLNKYTIQSEANDQSKLAPTTRKTSIRSDKINKNVNVL